MTQRFAQQLPYFKLDERARQTLRRLARLVTRRAPTALERLYESLRGDREAARHFTNDAVMERAQAAQLQHWQAMCSSGLDASYIARAEKVGQVHARIGLDTSLYLGAYAQVIGELLQSLSTRGLRRFLPGCAADGRASAVLVRAAIFDMNIAISSVMENMLEQVARGTAALHAGAGEIAGASDELAQRTERQALQVHEAASAVSEVNTMVSKSAADAVEMARAVAEAKKEADEGEQIVVGAVSAMEGIEQSSQHIERIVALIDSIAFQTNLLALNAGVEAARAGDSGKGFAVVATEVRALAQRSAEAAKDIKTLIGESSRQVGDGAQRVRATGDALQSLVSHISAISGLVGDVEQSCRKQEESITSINRTLIGIGDVSQQNAAMVEETNAASRSLFNELQGLVKMVRHFSIHRDAEPALSPDGVGSAATHTSWQDEAGFSRAA